MTSVRGKTSLPCDVHQIKQDKKYTSKSAKQVPEWKCTFHTLSKLWIYDLTLHHKLIIKDQGHQKKIQAPRLDAPSN